MIILSSTTYALAQQSALALVKASPGFSRPHSLHYQNSALGISISYPSNAKVKQDPNGVSFTFILGRSVGGADAIVE